MSDSDSAKFGGQPSMTQPMAGPWLSPKLVTRNNSPKVLPDMMGMEVDEAAQRDETIAGFYRPAVSATSYLPFQASFHGLVKGVNLSQ